MVCGWVVLWQLFFSCKWFSKQPQKVIKSPHDSSYQQRSGWVQQNHHWLFLTLSFTSLKAKLDGADASDLLCCDSSAALLFPRFTRVSIHSHHRGTNPAKLFLRWSRFSDNQPWLSLKPIWFPHLSPVDLASTSSSQMAPGSRLQCVGKAFRAFIGLAAVCCKQHAHWYELIFLKWPTPQRRRTFTAYTRGEKNKKHCVVFFYASAQLTSWRGCKRGHIVRDSVA